MQFPCAVKSHSKFSAHSHGAQKVPKCAVFSRSCTRLSSATVCCFTSYRPQRSCRKVILSQACVKDSIHRVGVSASVHAGIHTPLGKHPPPGRHPLGRHPPDRHTPGQTPLPRADGHCSGQYSSYWNAFLLRA